jgi:hypothetical protein
MTDFVAGHFELLLTVVLIPVAGGIYRHVRTKRKRGGSASDQAPPTKRAA